MMSKRKRRPKAVGSNTPPTFSSLARPRARLDAHTPEGVLGQASVAGPIPRASLSRRGGLWLALFLLLALAGAMLLAGQYLWGPALWEKQLSRTISLSGLASIAMAAPLLCAGPAFGWLAVEAFAHRRLLAVRVPAGGFSCSLCKRACHESLICEGCGSVVPIDTLSILAVFCVHRRAQILGVLGALMFGSVLTVEWQAVREYWKGREDEAQARAERADRATTHLASFRAALWEFASDCVPRDLEQQRLRVEAREHGALEHGAAPFNGLPLGSCSDAYRRILDGYIRWTWILPDFVADVRTSKECDKAAKETHPHGRFARYACELLQCEIPMLPVSSAYNRFTNAYARYVRSASNVDLCELEGSTKALFNITRRMGCATLMAGHQGPKRDAYDDTTGYCIQDFASLIAEESKRGRGSHKDKAWCSAALHPSFESSKPKVTPELEWNEWFHVAGQPSCSHIVTALDRSAVW